MVSKTVSVILFVNHDIFSIILQACILSEEDISNCKRSETEWACPITECNAVLSRKQTLKSHLATLHGVKGNLFEAQSS